MVQDLFNKLSAPIRGLHQAAYVLALLTLVSQILALLRDRTFATAFGAGPTLDLYYSAFRIPDLVFALIASLVSAYVLIPRLAGRGSDEVRELLSHSVSFLLLFGGIASGILAFFAPHILSLLYPSFADSPQHAEFVMLARVLLLQPIILGISGVITSVTQVHRRFMLFALSPVLYNLGIIFGAIVLYPYFGLLGIGYGVICGALMHAALHIPVLVHAEVFPRFVLPSWRILRGVIADSIPRSFALAMGSFTTLALTVLVAPIAAGSVSVFTFASNLVAVPLSLIGASYAVAAFPALSEHRVSENRDEFSRVLITSARHIVLWSLVSLGLIVVLRAHIVRSVLGAGAFDWQDTRLTAALLAVFTAGLVAQGLVLLFSRALYAAQQSWRPLIYQSIGGVATVLLAVYLLALPLEGLLADLSVLLRISDVGGASVLLVALAATLGQWLLALWSLGALWREAPLLARSLFRPLVHGMLAAVVGGAATYGVLYIEGGMLPLTTLLVVFTDGFIAGIVGLAASALLLAFLKNEEFLDVVRALLRSSGLRSALPPSAGESASS